MWAEKQLPRLNLIKVLMLLSHDSGVSGVHVKLYTVKHPRHGLGSFATETFSVHEDIYHYPDTLLYGSSVDVLLHIDSWSKSDIGNRGRLTNLGYCNGDQAEKFGRR